MEVGRFARRASAKLQQQGRFHLAIIRLGVANAEVAAADLDRCLGAVLGQSNLNDWRYGIFYPFRQTLFADFVGDFPGLALRFGQVERFASRAFGKHVPCQFPDVIGKVEILGEPLDEPVGL